MKININASELATIIGINPYQNIGEYLVKMWMKYDEDDYNRTMAIFAENPNIVLVDKLEDIDNVRGIIKKYGMDSNKLDECLSAKTTEELSHKKAELMREMREKTNGKTDVKEIEKQIESITNKKFGINNEGNALGIYKQKTGKDVRTSAKYISKRLFVVNGCDWYIGGKIDGITDDNIVVEIKNRIYKLFGKMREYERPQLHAYMYILGIKKGHLVESLKNGGSDINIIEDEFDDEYWSLVIMRKVQNYVKLYNFLLGDIDLKRFVMTGDDKNIQDFLKKMIDQI